MGVRVGDVAVIHYPCAEITGNYLTGKAFDNRAGCAVIIRCLESLSKKPSEISVAATFTIGEEKGLVGAQTAAYGLDPDIALVLEGTIGADIPGVEKRKQPVLLARGPAISIADSHISIPRRMWEFIEKIAVEKGIPYRFKMPTYSGTNAGAIHRSKKGVLTGIVSVPCRYIHSPVSTMRLDDFEHTVALTTHFIRRSHELLS
jgi:endoglucanase